VEVCDSLVKNIMELNEQIITQKDDLMKIQVRRNSDFQFIMLDILFTSTVYVRSSSIEID
jgi:hypothetical protein